MTEHRIFTPEQEKAVITRLKVAYIVNELQKDMQEINPKKIDPGRFYTELLRYVAAIAGDIGRKDAGEELEREMEVQSAGSPRREANAVEQLKKIYPGFGIAQTTVN